MATSIFAVLGGVGMFLLGMELMTAALREAAGGNLRKFLSYFTTTPLRGVMTGALATAVIQSSSATTVMTVGFVGAGLLTLQQALGVIYGANIGTTATGWMVSLLGFKLDLASMAMALLFPASLSVLLGSGAVARAGRILAGLCLLLVGLEMMQGGMGTVTSLVTPDLLPGDTLIGMLSIAAIGLVLTVLIQSSSAAVALSMVMLEGGAISLPQAGAIVIGMNVGTTFTALLASVGGSAAMRQTAVANLLFNLATSCIAMPLVAYAPGGLNALAGRVGDLNALLLFHSGFNILGAVLFVPMTGAFARLVGRLIPEREPDRIVTLDRALLADTDAALVAASVAASQIAERQFAALGRALRPEPDYRALSALTPSVETAVSELEAFLADIQLSEDAPAERQVFSALLHQADHLRRLYQRSQQRAPIAVLLSDRVLRRPLLTLGAILGRAKAGDGAGASARRLDRLQVIVDQRTNRHRRGMLLGEHVGIYSVAEVFEHTDAMRWMKRLMHHAQRIEFYNDMVATALRTGSAPN